VILRAAVRHANLFCAKTLVMLPNSNDCLWVCAGNASAAAGQDLDTTGIGGCIWFVATDDASVCIVINRSI
jgi:hypothetical protein